MTQVGETTQQAIGAAVAGVESLAKQPPDVFSRIILILGFCCFVGSAVVNWWMNDRADTRREQVVQAMWAEMRAAQKEMTQSQTEITQRFANQLAEMDRNRQNWERQYFQEQTEFRQAIRDLTRAVADLNRRAGGVDQPVPALKQTTGSNNRLPPPHNPSSGPALAFAHP